MKATLNMYCTADGICSNYLSSHRTCLATADCYCKAYLSCSTSLGVIKIAHGLGAAPINQVAWWNHITNIIGCIKKWWKRLKCPLVLSLVLSKKKKGSSFLIFSLSILLLSFHPKPNVFGHVRCEKKQEGEEERKDSSEGIWLILIWKYCFTSSEPNYCFELAVLGEQAQSHHSPDGQGLVGGSVTVTTVRSWTPGFLSAVAILLCSTSDMPFCYCWAQS